jgi:hypothetical protein
MQKEPALQLFEHGVVRCACWPIETLEPFSSPALAEAAAAAARMREAISLRRVLLCAVLHREIAQMSSRDTRRVLLETKRRIHTSTHPSGDAPIFLDAVRHLTHTSRLALLEDELERRLLHQLDRHFERLYADELARERSALHRSTQTAEFQRALAVANPKLAVQAAREQRSRCRVSRSRATRMEASILFYLIRAATRPTPGALWAGVASLRVADGISGGSHSGLTVAAAPRRVLVSVNLEPFVRAFERIRRHPRYRSRLRLAFSAYRDGEAWVFHAPGDGKHAWRTLVPDEPAAVLLDIFSDGRPRSLEDAIAVHLSALGGIHPEVDHVVSRLTAAANRLLECCLLTASVGFPPAAPDCWAALDEAATHLVANDREEWVARVASIRETCEMLSPCIDAMPSDHIHTARASIERELLSLYRWAGIDEPLPDPVLLVDVRSPIEVVVTREWWARVRAATVEVLSFYQSHGAAENLRRATMDAMLGDGIGVERPFLATVRINGRALDVSGGDMEPAAARLIERVRREVVARQVQWYERLVPSDGDRSVIRAPGHVCRDEPLAGFDGTVVFSVSATGHLRAEWGRPHALCLVSRFMPMLEESDGGGAALVDEIRKWYASWPAAGFAAAEITGADVMNPNAGTRPPLGVCRIDAAGENALAALVVGASAAGTRPWLRRKPQDTRLLAVYNCTGRIGAEDACSEALYRLALGHGWEFTCRRLFPRDETQERLPRVILPSGVTLSPARWFLCQEQVNTLLQLNGVQQYSAWLACARQLGLPDRVRVATESGPEEPLLYVPVTSPLAVRALLSKIAARPRSLEFVEDHADPGEWAIVDGHGNHYASEFVVCWHDPSYFARALDEARSGETP